MNLVDKIRNSFSINEKDMNFGRRETEKLCAGYMVPRGVKDQMTEKYASSNRFLKSGVKINFLGVLPAALLAMGINYGIQEFNQNKIFDQNPVIGNIIEIEGSSDIFRKLYHEEIARTNESKIYEDFLNQANSLDEDKRKYVKENIDEYYKGKDLLKTEDDRFNDFKLLNFVIPVIFAAALSFYNVNRMIKKEDSVAGLVAPYKDIIGTYKK
ncbi:hypothetical protein HN865_00490 [Candidatus Woesearchaeota archaeon]|jgi:hypothetical protein|nr:hypothetical protein [Candidatus Woesearchaeota archaeon]